MYIGQKVIVVKSKNDRAYTHCFKEGDVLIINHIDPVGSQSIKCSHYYSGLIQWMDLSQIRTTIDDYVKQLEQ